LPIEEANLSENLKLQKKKTPKSHFLERATFLMIWILILPPFAAGQTKSKRNFLRIFAPVTIVQLHRNIFFMIKGRRFGLGIGHIEFLLLQGKKERRGAKKNNGATKSPPPIKILKFPCKRAYESDFSDFSASILPPDPPKTFPRKNYKVPIFVDFISSFSWFSGGGHRGIVKMFFFCFAK
jgi:hypothetical protein